MGTRWAWTGIAIASIWVAVLFISLFAPTLQSTSAGGDMTELPLAGIVAAGSALLATIVVAALGFRDGPKQ